MSVRAAGEWLAAAARSTRDPSAAFQLAIAAAAAFRQAGDVAGAATLLREVSLSHYTHADAAKLHLQSAILWSDAVAPDALIEHLQECVTTWPADPFAAQATDWLVRLHEARGDPVAAAMAVSSADSALMTADRVAQAGLRWTQAILAAPFSQRAALVAQASAALDRDGVKVQSQPVIGQMTVLFADRDALRSIAPSSLQNRWLQWLLNIRQGAVAGELPSLEEVDPLLRVAAADRLIADGETVVNRAGLAGAILALVGPEPSLQAAQAYDWNGDGSRAESILAELIKRRPRDLELAASAARLLSRSTDPNTKRAGLRHWALLSAQLKQGTAEWHEAKLGAIELMRALGDEAEAKRSASYILLTQPPMDAALIARYRYFANSQRNE